MINIKKMIVCIFLILLTACQSSEDKSNLIIADNVKGKGFNVFILTNNSGVQNEIKVANNLVIEMLPLAIEIGGIFDTDEEDGRELEATYGNDKLPVYILVFNGEVVLNSNNLDEIKREITDIYEREY